jgi:ribosomal protein S18 acetylase RimI-like enzyme
MPQAHDELFQTPGSSTLDAVLVRNLELDDLEHVVRIDAKASGRSRREYYQRKLTEAVRESGIRISLAAELDGVFTGFLMGRLYYGEFGLPEPTAIIDSIGVDPEFRGRNVGQALMAQLETNLRGMGIESIQTQVDWQHFGLLGFLARVGFKPAPVLTLAKHLEREEEKRAASRT